VSAALTGALLEIRGVSVVFDGFRALSDVDLTIRQGELRFLIGPNGAGKTTLIDIVTGLAHPTEGEVVFDGRSIGGTKEHKIVRMGVGRTFQTPTVFESLSVVENLDLAESFRRSPIRMLIRRRGTSATIDTTLERIGLTAVAHRPAGTLSHGQKQWLEIGMLLVQQPRLLLLDEPVAGMSPEERTATGELLQELAGDHTLVVIEHDMAFLRRYAHTVTVLHEGRVLSEGTVQEVQADERVREVYLGRSRDERSGASLDKAVDGAAVATEVGA
jgi:urea transport system ATP-binding protein